MRINESSLMFTSSVISNIITYPVETIKILKQSNNNIINLKYLYSGIKFSIILKPLFWGNMYFLKDKINISNNKLINYFVCANISSLILNPIFILCTKYQARVYNKTITNIFSGYNYVIIKNIKTCMDLILIEKLHNYLNQTQTNKIYFFFSSLLIKSISNLIFYPIDTLLTRKRINYTNNIFKNLYSGSLVHIIHNSITFTIMMTIFYYLKEKIN